LTEDKPATADVMHVSMMRAGGGRFQVELFNFQFCGLGGRTCHLLGLRDFGDTDNTLAPMTEISPSESFAGRCSVAVIVDSAELGLPVLWFSEGLKHLMPRVARHACLLDDLVDNDDDFNMWIESAVNSHYTENSDNKSANAFQVRLKAGGRRRVFATCSAAFEDDVEMPKIMHNEDAIPVRLTFHDICNHSSSSYSNSSSRRSRRRGTPPRSHHTHLDSQLR